VAYGTGKELQEGVSLYLMELPEDIGDGDGGGGIPSSVIIAIVVIVVLVVLVAVVLVLMGRRRATAPLEIPEVYEEEVAPAGPVPPPPSTAVMAMPPAPPPPAQARTAEELLRGTRVMHRESRAQDAWSVDREYAEGRTLRSVPAPVYMGDCQFCGGRVLEHSSGAIMCEKCGAQFTHE